MRYLYRLSALANFEYTIFQKQVKMDNTEKEPSKSSSICIAEEPYCAPYARVSSMEDPSTRNSEYGKAAPTSLETAAFDADTGKARVSDQRNSLEKIPETTEKPHVKESAKGFRRLLKFGKKSHSPATRNMESDNVSVDGSEADEIGTNGSSNEGNAFIKVISRLKLLLKISPTFSVISMCIQTDYQIFHVILSSYFKEFDLSR